MLYLLLSIYAHVHGQTNAFLYSVKGAEALPENEHRWLVIERALLWLACLLGFVYYPADGYLAFLILCGELVAAALAFSFWHNRAYYLMRDRIDGTTHGARYQSPTSTAKTDLSYGQRKALLLMSLSVLLLTLCLYLYLKHHV